METMIILNSEDQVDIIFVQFCAKMSDVDYEKLVNISDVEKSLL